jgi:membrane protein YdbS with pleckstrin-like domain
MLNFKTTDVWLIMISILIWVVSFLSVISIPKWVVIFLGLVSLFSMVMGMLIMVEKLHPVTRYAVITAMLLVTNMIVSLLIPAFS